MCVRRCHQTGTVPWSQGQGQGQGAGAGRRGRCRARTHLDGVIRVLLAAVLDKPVALVLVGHTVLWHVDVDCRNGLKNRKQGPQARMKACRRCETGDGLLLRRWRLLLLRLPIGDLNAARAAAADSSNALHQQGCASSPAAATDHLCHRGLPLPAGLYRTQPARYSTHPQDRPAHTAPRSAPHWPAGQCFPHSRSPPGCGRRRARQSGWRRHWQ